MTDDKRVLDLLGEVLDELPKIAPDRLLAAVTEEIQRVPQRGRWRTVSAWRGIASRRRSRPVLFVGLVVVGVIGIAIGQLTPRPVVGPGATSTPSSTLAPSPTPTVSPSAAAPSQSQSTPSSTLDFSSRLFVPQVSWTLDPYWCLPMGSGVSREMSPRSIVVAYAKGCVSDMRLIRPWAVDCGAAGAHPNAASLEAAVQQALGDGALDRGDLQAAAPASLLVGTYSGRVIAIGGKARAFDSSVTDPNHCRLLPEPGSGDPIVEIRSDMSALLVLLDVHDELVVLRVADAGYDSPSGVAARARGTGSVRGPVFWTRCSMRSTTSRSSDPSPGCSRTSVGGGTCLVFELDHRPGPSGSDRSGCCWSRCWRGAHLVRGKGPAEPSPCRLLRRHPRSRRRRPRLRPHRPCRRRPRDPQPRRFLLRVMSTGP